MHDQGAFHSSQSSLPSELFRLQETNEALSYDMKGVLDNKMRVESENFLLKMEIQRMREQN